MRPEPRNNNIDIQSVQKVCSIKFKNPQRDQAFLHLLYLLAHESRHGFQEYYKDKIQRAIRYRILIVDDDDDFNYRKGGGYKSSSSRRLDASGMSSKDLLLDETEEFFSELIEAFEHVNYYNLLVPKEI